MSAPRVSAREPARRLACARRCGDPKAENRIVRGDNAEVLARLAGEFAGRFQLVYLDPPFNTGRVFDAYADAWKPEAWREMMRTRLERVAPLVAAEGTVVAEIDDTELGALLVLMDETFGRENRAAVITLVRSATTGHKAKNRGPVNVTDYLLVYARDRRVWRPKPLVRPRAGRDRAYGLVIENPESAVTAWRFGPLGAQVAAALGHPTRAAAVRALGREAFEVEIARWSLAHADRVVRFAQPRYEAVSREARAAIDRSRAQPERIVVLERAGHKPMILRGGNRLLFLADKTRTVDGVTEVVEPLTNVWDDIPFQGIAREGGVTFTRNKKPERLLERIVEMTTEPGDWVLDPFLGSGTTAAVAHKMARRWVGIESGPVLDDLCIPRLERVVRGEDPTGITRRRGWVGGGGFGVYA